MYESDAKLCVLVMLCFISLKMCYKNKYYKPMLYNDSGSLEYHHQLYNRFQKRIFVHL